MHLQEIINSVIETHIIIVQKTQIRFTSCSRGVSNALSSVSHREANGRVLTSNWKVNVSANNSNKGTSSLSNLPLTLLYPSRTKEEENWGRRQMPLLLSCQQPARQRGEITRCLKKPRLDGMTYGQHGCYAGKVLYCTHVRGIKLFL